MRACRFFFVVLALWSLSARVPYAASAGLWQADHWVGRPPEPKELKVAENAEVGVVFDRVVKMRWQAAPPQRQIPTATWPTNQSFRSMPVPDNKTIKSKLTFLPERAREVEFQLSAARLNCDLNRDGKFSGPEELLTERNVDASLGPIVLPAAWPDFDDPAGRYVLYAWKQFNDGRLRLLKNESPTKDRKIAGFVFSRGCFMTGRIPGGPEISIFDDNVNGRYDDWGRDGLLFGDAAQPLSPILLLPAADRTPSTLDAELFRLSVAPSGTIVILGKHVGPTGTLTNACPKAPQGAQWRFVVFSGDQGFFELSRFEGKAVPLPPGQYLFHTACFSLRGQEIFIEGQGPSFVIKENEKSNFPDWTPAIPETRGK